MRGKIKSKGLKRNDVLEKIRMHMEGEEPEECACDHCDCDQEYGEEIDIEAFDVQFNLKKYHLEGIEIDEEMFEKGVRDISYQCGMIKALQEMGMKNEEILEYLINKEAIDFNQSMGKENNKVQIEIAKIGQYHAEKNMP